MATAVYPGNVLSWTPRIDEVNVVFANDPNTLAVEVQAIESTVGTTPQIESSPPAGSPVTYPTLSSRVSAAMNGALLPFVSVNNSAGLFLTHGQQSYNHYPAQIVDPYNIWNGSSLTIPCSGWWTIRSDQRWSQQGGNFGGCNHHFMYCNGNWFDHDHWNWGDRGTSPGWPDNVFNGDGWTKIRWEGLLNKGDIIQILSVNSTSCDRIKIYNMSLKVFCHRTISTPFISG